MNRYDAYITDFLLENKTVSLEKIGIFSITGSAGSMEYAAETGGLTFIFDKRAATSPGLIEYIAGHIGKSKVLVAGDISSRLEQARQFINIGKPYEIQGLGFININNMGQYEFVAKKSGTREDTGSKTRRERETGSNSRITKNTNRNFVMLLALFIVVVIAGVLGWGAYKLFFEKTGEQTQDTTSLVSPPPVNNTNTDTTTQNKDTTAKNTLLKDSTTTSGDSSLYKFIFETTYSSQRAYSRINALQKMGDDAKLDSIPGDSTMIYHLFILKKLPVTDTASFKDSLHLYFNRTIRIKPV